MKKFLLLSRTWKTDYHVLECNGTQASYDDEKKFFESLKYAQIIDTEKFYAVIFTQGRSIYILSGGIRTGNKDKDGRAIRFAFYACFNLRERGQADNIFLGLVNNWDNAPDIINSCMDPEAYKLDKIIFDPEKFIAKLKDYEAYINFNEKSNAYKFIHDEKRIAVLKLVHRKNIVSTKIIAYSLIFIIACVVAYFMPSLFANKPQNEIMSPSPRHDSNLEAVSRDVNQVFHESKSKFLSRPDDIYIKIEYEALLYITRIFSEIYNAYYDSDSSERIIDLTREALNLTANIKDSVSSQGAEIFSDMARSKIDEAKNLLDNIHCTD